MFNVSDLVVISNPHSSFYGRVGLIVGLVGQPTGITYKVVFTGFDYTNESGDSGVNFYDYEFILADSPDGAVLQVMGG